MPITTLIPNEHGDWISVRNDSFTSYIPVDSEKKFDIKANSFFIVNSRGLETARDAWVYNSAKEVLRKNANSLVEFYNNEVERFKEAKKENMNIKVNDFINTDPTKISWSSSLIPKVANGKKNLFEPNKIITSLYRPFCKQLLYYGEMTLHRKGQWEQIFPKPYSIENFAICISGIGVTKDFTAIITNIIPDLEISGKSQCFPLYYYEENNATQKGMFDDDNKQDFIRRDAISDFILDRAKAQYGKNVTKEDIFYYVYGFLHSPEYRKLFTNDLKKMLPRLPLVEDVKDFWAFSKAGRELAELHINYETVPAYLTPTLSKGEGEKPEDYYRVEKMRFPKKGQKDTILVNSKITISNIPAKAYEYVVNGKSAIEWIMERYQITTNKESGIKNDPNDWAKEVGNPKYILDLLLSVINVSVQTVDIVQGLPKVKFQINS